MLTNNKKRSFVKLIALTLAALMVFSVCLTGCTDEDARLAADAAKDAADKAQSSADAAQTAADSKTTTEAVAAQIAEALKPYLKADAALTEADVDKKVADLKAAIEASLKNYQAKGDYATKADVNKKQDKGDYATKTELTNAVKDALKPYLKASDALTAANVTSAIETALKGYQAKGDYATKTEVTEAVKDALKGYATEDGVDVAINAAIADYATKADVAAALESFAAFAKSEDLEALSAALSEAMGAALTEEKVTEIAKNVMADYEIDVKIAEAVAAQDELTMAAVTELINETLKKYLTAEEIDARFEAAADELAGVQEALKQELADAKTALENADAAAAEALAAEVAKLEKALADAQAALDAADAEAAEALKAEVAKLEKALADADAAAAEALAADVAKLEKALADAKTELGTAADEALKEAVAKLEEALAATKAELDTKIEDTKAALEKRIATIEGYFSAFAEEDMDKIPQLLASIDKKMDADQWSAATVLITDVLENAKNLFNYLVAHSYTQENKKAINDILATIAGKPTGITIFPTIKNANGEYLGDAFIDMFINPQGGTYPVYEKDATTGSFVRNDDMIVDGQWINSMTTADATAKILTDLTVFILRAATVDEINAINDAIKRAQGVADFEKEMTDWREFIYDIGEVVPVAVKKDGKYTDQATWTGIGNNNDGTKKPMMYHGKTVTDGSVKKAQVATAFDRADFNTALARLEEMVVEYALEAMNFGRSYMNYSNYYRYQIKSLYAEKNSKGEIVDYVWYNPGSYKGEVYNGMNVSALTGATATIDKKYTFVGIYAGIDNTGIPGTALGKPEYFNMQRSNWTFTDTASLTGLGEVMTGYVDDLFLEPKIKVDLLDQYGNKNNFVTRLLNKFTQKAQGEDAQDSIKVQVAETFDALNSMIKDAEEAIAKANAAFTGKDPTNQSSTHSHDPQEGTYTDGFLWHMGHTYTALHNTKADGSGNYKCDCQLHGDDWYVKELRSFMVEYTQTSSDEEVPTHWSRPVWLTPVHNVVGTDAPWNHRDPQARTIDVYFNYALNINGETGKVGVDVTEFKKLDRFDLYLRLREQAWVLLYQKYKGYAADVLLTMRNDFQVAAKAATLAASNAPYVGQASEAAKALGYKNNDVDVAKKWTEAFLAKYYAGSAAENDWAWYVGSGVLQKQVGPSYTLPGLDHYYDYNGVGAKRPSGVNTFDVGSTIDGNPGNTNTVYSDVVAALKASEQRINIELDAVTFGPRLEILNDAANFKDSGMGEFEYKKAQGGRVQDAFNEELQVAYDNFMEIMYRYMLPEINDSYINKAYAAIATIDAENNTEAKDLYTGGVATYFDKDPGNVSSGTKAALVHMMQVYVTGHATNAVTGMQQGWYTYTQDKATLFAMNNPATYHNANKTMTVNVVPATVYDKLFANITTDFAVAQTISRDATKKVENAATIYSEAVNSMANMAVKYRFVDYIQHAKDALYNSYLSYYAVAGNYETTEKLLREYNEGVEALDITEYYVKRLGIVDKYNDEDYLNVYVTRVLNVAIAHDSTYYSLIDKNTSYKKQLLDHFASANAFINNADPTDTITDAWDLVLGVSQMTPAKMKPMLLDKWIQDIDFDSNGKIEGTEKNAGDILIVIPASSMNGAFGDKNYYATGAAAVEFDKIVNANSAHE